MIKKDLLKRMKESQELLKQAQQEINLWKAIQENARVEVEQASKSCKESSNAMQKSPYSYSEKSFWDDRYSRNNGSSDIYEWYVPFETIKHHLESEIFREPDDFEKSVILPGCGNSALGEDLHRFGCQNVVGIDYSTDVIDAMKKRAESQKLGISYRVGDVCQLTSHRDLCIDVVVDKGTLDAICSGSEDGGSTLLSSPGVNAVNYVREMWRVLAVGGYLVLISTAPKEVLLELFVVNLQLEKYSNWSSCCYSSIPTSVGGIVYLYVIRKSGNLPGAMSQGIRELLEEATKYLTEAEEFAEVAGASTICFQSEDVVVADEQPLVVTISIASLEAISKGSVVARLELVEGQWEEGDCLAVVCSSDSGIQREYKNRLYRPQDQPFECFEFVDDISQPLSLMLPAYGGNFALAYIRYSKTIAAGSQSRRVVECGRSNSFTVSVPLFGGHPDRQQQQQQQQQPLPMNILRRRAVGRLESTRCIDIGGISVPVQFCSIVDYLQGISVLKINCVPLIENEAFCAENVVIQRILGWIYASSCGRVTTLVEVDVIHFSGESVSLTTAYLELPIAGMSLETIDLAKCSLSIQPNTNRIELRIKMMDSFVVNVPKSTPPIGVSSCSINILCEFCGQELVKTDAISNMVQEPSGYFDNMMHEFYCCENISAHTAMAAGDVVASSGTARIGPIQISVCAADTVFTSTCFGCKLFPSLGEFFINPTTATMFMSLNSGLDKKSSEFLISDATARMMCIESCAVSCNRCGIQVGDGIFKPNSASTEENADLVTLSEMNSIQLSDLQVVRFNLASVQIESSAAGQESMALGLISAEATLGRTLLHLSDLHSINTFCLYPYTGATSKAAYDVIFLKIVSKNCLFMLVAPNSLFDMPENEWVEGIRVSFAITTNSNGKNFPLKAKEARINIPMEDGLFARIGESLARRSKFSDLSMNPEQLLSVLLI